MSALEYCNKSVQRSEVLRQWLCVNAVVSSGSVFQQRNFRRKCGNTCGVGIAGARFGITGRWDDDPVVGRRRKKVGEKQ